MDIKIEQYITPEEIKEIVASEIRLKVAYNSERILSNLAYECAFSIIDSLLGESEKALIREKTIKILKDTNSYSVFRKKNAWEKEDSPATLVLNRTIEENKGHIVDNITEAIRSFDYKEEVYKKVDSEYLHAAICDIFRRGLL